MLLFKRIISNDRGFSNKSGNQFASFSQTKYDYGWGKDSKADGLVKMKDLIYQP